MKQETEKKLRQPLGPGLPFVPPTKDNWGDIRRQLLEACPVSLYDAEKRACSVCAQNRVCAQMSIYFLRLKLEPAVRNRSYPGTYTLDEAVQTVHLDKMHESFPVGTELSRAQIAEMFKTHDDVLVSYIQERIKTGGIEQ